MLSGLPVVIAAAVPFVLYYLVQYITWFAWFFRESQYETEVSKRSR